MDNREKTWRGIQAALLSIIPGVGHLYLGEKRGYWLLIAGMALLMLSRLWWLQLELLYMSLAIVSAFDAYGIAKRGYGLI
jgi:hypothetical protein